MTLTVKDRALDPEFYGVAPLSHAGWALNVEITRYLRAVTTFRDEGCAPTYEREET